MLSSLRQRGALPPFETPCQGRDAPLETQFEECEICVVRSGRRPIAVTRQSNGLLRCSTLDRPFAATAKSGGRRTHTVRDFPDIEDLGLVGCFLRFATTSNDSNVPTSLSKHGTPVGEMFDVHQRHTPLTSSLDFSGHFKNSIFRERR